MVAATPTLITPPDRSAIPPALFNACFVLFTINAVYFPIAWFSHWWIRMPLRPFDDWAWPPQMGSQIWSASLWGAPADRALILALLVAGALGIWILNETRQRAAARLLGLASAGFLSLTVGGLLWQPLSRLGSEQLLVPALWFAMLPAMHAVGMVVQLVERLAGNPHSGHYDCRGALALDIS